MIRAETPGGHELVVIVYSVPNNDGNLTHMAECEGCGAQYIIRCDRPLLVEVMDNVHPTRMREYLTYRAMCVDEEPIDTHVYDHIWGMIEFFDEGPCSAEGPIRIAQDGITGIHDEDIDA